MWPCLAMVVSNVIRGISHRTGHALGLISPGLLLGWTGSLPSRRLAQGPVLISQDTI